jgi:uncharacterized protein YxjI
MKKIFWIILVPVVSIAILVAVGLWHISPASEGKHFYCDVKVISLSTDIKISEDSKVTRKVAGDILRFLTDPLTLYDADGNKIGYAGDSYRVVAQDAHGIYLGDKFKYDMDGKVDFLGETYKLYDAEGVQVGRIEFNFLDTKGTLYDMEDKVLATYASNVLRQDYIVTISETCQIESDALLLLFASYVSDKNADSSN